MKVKTLIYEKSSKSRDPYVLNYQNKYYYCFSRDDKIYICVSASLDDLNQAKEYTVYENLEGYKNLWAPELHIINNCCYIYVACDDGTNENHRMYVLSNHSDNPLNVYKNYGIISDVTNKWAIDGTVWQYNNELYFIWSGCDKDIHFKQELFIAKMKDPFTISSEKVLISSPEYLWERNGGDGKNLAFINEGPAILDYNNKIYIAYSASGCWCKDYCIGLLELVDKNNPLSAKSWKKYNKPILSTKQNLIGPGHCCFTKGNNNEMYMAFHSFYDDILDLSNVNARYINLDDLLKDWK